MSIAILNQVHDEVRRLAIAGSNLAAGDFRLKKLTAPLQQAGEKVPVIAKVAQALDQLVSSSTENSAAALLELSTLVGAIRYTQGETGVAGMLRPIEGTEFPLPVSTASARILKPLIEALTTTGSGREQIIRDAHERGAFNDLRLIPPALRAIDDPYAPIGDFVADNVLQIYGRAIFAQLREAYDPKGHGGDARRLRLMCHIDQATAKELVDEALDSGSKDVKLAALGCLKGKKDALPLLLDQSKSKNKEVRAAALASLAESTDEVAVDALIAVLRTGEAGMIANHVAGNMSAKLLDYTVQETKSLVDDALASDDKAERSKKLSRLVDLLSCFSGRDDKPVQALLSDCFARRDELTKLTGGDVDGQVVNVKVAALMALSGSKPLQKELAHFATTLEPELLGIAFVAAIACSPPSKVYDSFSSYLLKATSKNVEAGRKRDAVRAILLSQNLESVGHPGYWQLQRHDSTINRDLARLICDAKLDPRWLDDAVKTDDVDLVVLLARPNHKPTLAFLTRRIKEQLKKPDNHEVFRLLETMNRIEHHERVEHFLNALRVIGSAQQARYGLWWLLRVVPGLPQHAVPKIEEVLPTLPEKVVDEIVPHLTELKSKS